MTTFQLPSRRSVLRASSVAIAGAAVAPLATLARAEDWKPTKDVEVVVGVAPGGAQDRTARDVERLLKANGSISQKSVVLNKPGGGHAVALAYTRSKAKDPHYLQVTGGVVLSNNILGRSPIKYTDFTPIAMLFDEEMAFAVKVDSPIKDARDLLERLRKDAGSVSFSISTGIGTSNHISALLVANCVGADLKLKVVSFNSAAEGVTATLGGHIDVVITTPFALDPFIEAGQFRYIAVASAKRSVGRLAQAPTWKEAGVDAVVSAWRVVLAPPGLTSAQISYWDKSFAGVRASSEWQQMMAKENFLPHPLDSAGAASFLADEDKRYRKVLSIVTNA